MSTYILKLIFHLATLTRIAVASSFPRNNNIDTLSWGPCDDAPALLECATFQVPRDWADEQKGKINLAVIRLPAATQSREGYMFYNPGGPGASGLDLITHVFAQGYFAMHTVTGAGDLLQSRLGQSWDVLSWDPRGVGRSEPNMTLFPDNESYDQFWSQMQGLGHFDAHGNLTTPSDVDFFLSQAQDFDNLLQSFNDQYVAKFGDDLKYIGSAAVVRDLVALTEAIYGEGADVNFYGISYGTLLAVYLTQMFPDRVGKVIIDGVLDAYSYSNEPSMAGFALDVEDAEKALQGWASYCIAAPERCAMSAIGNGTVSGIIAVIDKILDTAYQTYDGTIWTNGTAPASPRGWTFDDIAWVVYTALFAPMSWKSIEDALIFIVSQQSNLTSSDNTMSTKIYNLPKRNSPSDNIFGRSINRSGYYPRELALSDLQYAIFCGDAIDYNNVTTQSVLEEIIRVSQTVSPHFGSLISPRWICHKWTSRAVERLPVPITTKPKNVVLVIGNTADPATPYSAAQLLASNAHLGEMARLVKFHAVGHCSLSNNSTCINNVISSYIRGDLPADAGNDDADVECEIDANPFSP